MLEELRISNFAIIDQIELAFASGFNVITGETGAGKSIVIDALELLLGGKADSGWVRAGADRATVEGTFKLTDRVQARIIPILEREDLMNDTSDAIILSRELRSNGRSTARVNGSTVNNDILREIGEALVDIHGQSEHLSLFKPRAHLDLLDRYADLLEVRDALSQVVAGLGDIRRQIKSLTEDKEALARRAERLRYEIEEIDAAQLDPAEEEGVLADRNKLANSEQLATLAGEAHQILNGDDSEVAVAAVDQIMQVSQIMSKLARLDPTLKDDSDMAQQLADNVQELAITIAGYVEEIEYNPDRLNQLEERLEVIRSLKKRFKVETIPGILDYATAARTELESLDQSEERLIALQKQEEKTLHHIGELCQRMSKVREIAGRNLGKRIVRELEDLRMGATQFEVIIRHTETPDGCYVAGKRYAFDATGMDQLEFMMSANPGEPLRPLAKVASGGEAARIMLALKRVLSQADETPTLVFDEIDQGIGGRIGAVVGEKLWSLASGHQVMVVTHLPQLAGYGDAHFQVRKEQLGERTRTAISVLTADEQRIDELAAMLGALGEAGKQSAQELLSTARTRKSELAQPVIPRPQGKPAS